MSFIKNKALGFFVKTNGYFSKYLFGGKGITLMFHRVRPKLLMSKFEQNKQWEITPENLENIIKFFIKNKFNIISANQINDFINSSNKTPFVIFTFDDGYFDNLEYAYPVFKKYNVPFTVFVTSSYIKGKRYPWEFLIENFLNEISNFSFIYLNKKFSYKDLNENEKTKVFSQIYSIIKNNNNSNNLDNTLENIFGDYLTSNYKTIEIIKPEMISELKNDKIVSFGIHTDNHYVLSQLTYNEQLNEINNSLDYLKNLLGDANYVMAFPYGGSNDINSDTLKIINTTNIKYCFTTWPGNIFAKSNSILIPRYSIEMKTDEKELNYLINGIRHFSYNGFSRKNSMENFFKR